MEFLNDYKLRVHLDNCTRDQIYTFVKEVSVIGMICFEGMKGKRPHMHAWIRAEKMPSRYQLKKIIGEGNGIYSMGQLKPEGEEDYPLKYIAYLMKENDYEFFGEVPEDIVEQANKRMERIEAEKAERKKKRKAERVIKTLIYEVEEYVKANSKVRVTVRDVINVVLKYHDSKDMCYRKFQIISYVQTIMCRISSEFRIDYIGNLIRDCDPNPTSYRNSSGMTLTSYSYEGVTVADFNTIDNEKELIKNRLQI